MAVEKGKSKLQNPRKFQNSTLKPVHPEVVGDFLCRRLPSLLSRGFPNPQAVRHVGTRPIFPTTSGCTALKPATGWGFGGEKKRKPGHNSGLLTHTHLRTKCVKHSQMLPDFTSPASHQYWGQAENFKFQPSKFKTARLPRRDKVDNQAACHWFGSSCISPPPGCWRRW
jgi:hypothetical protein